MKVEIIGKKNNCNHTLKPITSNVKWCSICGAIQKDTYDSSFVLIKRELQFPDNKC